MLTTGSEGPYQWLVTDKPFDLLELCAEIVLGKFVAITSIDSGIFQPTEAEIADGWRSSGQIAYSPKIRKVEELPRAGWDEWYIFENPTDLGMSHLAENIFEVPHHEGTSVFSLTMALRCTNPAYRNSRSFSGGKSCGFTLSPT